MLTGEPLFPGESDIDQLYLITKCFGVCTCVCVCACACVCVACMHVCVRACVRLVCHIYKHIISHAYIYFHFYFYDDRSPNCETSRDIQSQPSVHWYEATRGKRTWASRKTVSKTNSSSNGHHQGLLKKCCMHLHLLYQSPSTFLFSSYPPPTLALTFITTCLLTHATVVTKVRPKWQTNMLTTFETWTVHKEWMVRQICVGAESKDWKGVWW